MRTVFSILGLAFVPLFLLGQQSDSLDAAKHYERYEKLVEQEKYDEAFQSVDLALASYKKADLLGNWLYAQIQKGKLMATARNQPFEAMQYLDGCTARDMWRAPKNRSEHIEHCYFYLDKSYIAKQYTEDFVLTKIALEKAYDIFHRDLGAEYVRIAEYMYFQLANAYIRLREYKSATRIFEEALAYSIKHNAPAVAKYNDYAGLYVAQENYPKAKQILLDGIARKGVPETDLLFTKVGLVECLAQMKDFDGALKINRALEATLKMPLKTEEAIEKLPEFQYNVQENYAILYSNKGDRKNALYWYHRAYDTAYKYAKSSKRLCGYYQICIGNLLLEDGDAKASIDYFQAALKTIVPKFDAPVTSNPNPEALKAESVVLRALYGKAKAFETLGQLDQALGCYELIPIVEAKLRSTHAYESSSLLALSESRKRTHEALDLAWKIFEQSNGNPQYAARAFRMTEQARGMLLLQSLVQAQQFLPDQIREKDYGLRVRMAWLEHEIAAELELGAKADRNKIKGWEDQLFKLKIERQNLLADFPSYTNPDSFFLQAVSAKKVRNLLRPGQAMVDFFLTETAAYVFSFDANGDFRWRKTPLPAQFREQTKQLASFLWADKSEGREPFLRQAWLLDSLLLLPECHRWGSKINSLVLVPDDVLMLVPFEVLLSRGSNSSATWREQPWLLKTYNFGYAYSATLLEVQKGIAREHDSAESKPFQPFGGFAPSYEQTGAYPLKNTFPMVETVHKMLGGEAWYGKDASEERFKNSTSRYRILLLAMHGISDNERPELSRLLFGDPGPDSLINNNILYGSELQIMQLQADLVVLSACHTGSGKIELGEGMYSLARAFAAARVPTTVMSLWLLHETTAQPLVEGFFRFLKEGKSEDEALRLAKLEFIQNDENFELTHPFYWAGLVAAGDMGESSGISWWWWGLAFLGVSGGVFWQIKRRKNRAETR